MRERPAALKFPNFNHRGRIGRVLKNPPDKQMIAADREEVRARRENLDLLIR
jgi:hypothetical protein